jgi:hypothetical protein
MIIIASMMAYFVPPGTSAAPGGPPDNRRSSLQVVELKYAAANNVLTADRNSPTMINLQSRQTR